ncbi:hypothetical protein L3X37_04860 [Sabulilitoribacter arenilitoris]|uniref:Uncharacterized protein n=1 Tax=Wocania arenilitoris TaxID=2044858 RepID=A0AAE3ELP1_9FLAO|nr:hypothetical protein [Wocania arenilitoris]MCF7567695.1 hypothetical protein [Wocania arenilitoris]
MKIIEKGILPFQEKDFFFPIRDKEDYVRLILNSLQYILIGNDIEEVNLDDCNSKMKIVVDRMSRLFFYQEGKYFSVSFPFTLLLDDYNNIIEVSTFTGTIIESESVSMASSILKDGLFQLNQSLVDYYIESTNIESSGIDLLEIILHSEPAYLRYDHDPVREDAKLHPLHHLDINYSSYGTYKLGLNKLIIENYFESVVNINTDCSYLEE